MASVVFKRMCQGFVGVPDEEIVNGNHYSRLVALHMKGKRNLTDEVDNHNHGYHPWGEKEVGRGVEQIGD
jgi:hypothetical protein